MRTRIKKPAFTLKTEAFFSNKERRHRYGKGNITCGTETKVQAQPEGKNMEGNTDHFGGGGAAKAAIRSSSDQSAKPKPCHVNCVRG